MSQNREFTRGCRILAVLGLGLSAVGLAVSPLCAGLILLTALACGAVYVLTERSRYRRLQQLTAGLDALLDQGQALTIAEYQEGELSILANQLQKLVLQLKESAEAVEADKRWLADSLADISHQLRTPLTAMNLTTTMLRSPELSEQRRQELTGELRALLSRTEWLVETLLKISKLDAGTATLQPEQITAQALIRQAAQPLAIPMELRGQMLMVCCENEGLLADMTWTAEALGNILKNCMEHTPDGGVITVTACETALYTEIRVEDTGPGFVPQDIPHLFERFYKGSNAAEGSYGIGLALARTVITAQNGTITAQNGDRGAKFVVKFYKQVI